MKLVKEMTDTELEEIKRLTEINAALINKIKELQQEIVRLKSQNSKKRKLDMDYLPYHEDERD